MGAEVGGVGGSAIIGQSYIIKPANNTIHLAIGAAAAMELLGILLDCSLNPGEDVTLRIWDYDSTGADPTVGVTDAELWVRGKRGKTDPDNLFWFTTGDDEKGWVFGSGDYRIAAACVQQKGGTGGATSPSGIVVAHLFFA
jgi:hypothetical protein